jgi:nucleoside-diphosphate-sugar epimerase
MTILLTGATGFVGSAVLSQLIARGHAVTAIVRSAEKAAQVEAAGATAVLGDAADSALLARLVAESDGVIHTAAPGDGSAETFDAGVVAAVLGALDGTDKPYVHTGGVWVFGDGDAITEEQPFEAPAITAWRAGVEATVRASSVRTTIIAPGIVYGHGGGIPNVLVSDPVRLIGDGSQHWTTVYVDDLGALYALAVEHAAQDAFYLGVSGQSPTVGELADAAAHGGAIVTESLEETRARLGEGFADALLLDQQATGELVKSELGWTPVGPSLVEELGSGSYLR